MCLSLFLRFDKLVVFSKIAERLVGEQLFVNPGYIHRLYVVAVRARILRSRRVHVLDDGASGSQVQVIASSFFFLELTCTYAFMEGAIP